VNWKDFFRPDWKKIILTFIITFLNFVYILSLFGKEPTFISYIFWWPIVIGSLLCPVTYDVPFSLLDLPCIIIFYIINLIYWYLLSCLIFFIYDKFKGVKK